LRSPVPPALATYSSELDGPIRFISMTPRSAPLSAAAPASTRTTAIVRRIIDIHDESR
jgi:hypothetical protein